MLPGSTGRAPVPIAALRLSRPRDSRPMRRTMRKNTLASWSVGLGLLSMAFLVDFWPASPPVAIAAIVCGILGVRAARRYGFGGESRALVGIAYGAIALVVLGVIVYVFYWSGIPT